MSRAPSVCVLLLGGLFLVALGSPVDASLRGGASAQAAISGVVRDTLGNALNGVEILVLPERSGEAPFAAVHTDDLGRYRIGYLVPGVYRVAAIKQGYVAFVGRVNTLFKSSLDMILHPVPPAVPDGSPAIPEDASWALRLPVRSVLRETDAGTLLLREGGGRSASAWQEIAQSIDGQFDHLVAIASMAAPSARESVGMQGAETRMRLAGSIGERASVHVQGRRETLDGLDAPGANSNLASRDASTMLVGFDYSTSPDGNLAVKAFYAQGGEDLAGSPDALASRLRREQRSWGYHAAWSTQIDATSRLAVKLGYLDTLDGVTESAGASPAKASIPRDADLSNRAVAAEGSYESFASSRHQVRLGVQARVLDTPRVTRDGTIALLPASARPAQGWGFRVDAEDHWSVSAPLTVIYGLGCRRSPLDPQVPYIAPRVGGVWNAGRLRVRAVVSYDVPAYRSQVRAQDGSLAATAQMPQRFGYEAAVEAPLPLGLSVKGSVSYTPAASEADRVDAPRWGFGFRPVLAADGTASVRQSSISLDHHAGGVRTFLQYRWGIMDGFLARTDAFDVPIQFLGKRHVSYDSGRVGVRVAAWGTELAAEYQRVREEAGVVPLDDEGLTREFIELQLAQDLLPLHGKAMSWKLLLAARAEPAADTAEERVPATSEARRSLLSANRRVSAGLSLVF